MREIKFRAWDKGRKQFVEPASLRFNHHELSAVTVYDKPGKVYTGPPEHIEIMQFTGATDKNGAEIYDGDILRDRYRKDTDWKPKSSDNLEKVWWNEEYFRWQLGDFMDLSEAINSDETTLEIVGNIYENPALLTAPSPDKESNE